MLVELGTALVAASIAVSGAAVEAAPAVDYTMVITISDDSREPAQVASGDTVREVPAFITYSDAPDCGRDWKALDLAIASGRPGVHYLQCEDLTTGDIEDYAVYTPDGEKVTYPSVLIAP